MTNGAIFQNRSSPERRNGLLFVLRPTPWTSYVIWVDFMFVNYQLFLPLLQECSPWLQVPLVWVSRSLPPVFPDWSFPLFPSPVPSPKPQLIGLLESLISPCLPLFYAIWRITLWLVCCSPLDVLIKLELRSVIWSFPYWRVAGGEAQENRDSFYGRRSLRAGHIGGFRE